jgi:ketosteroid isomerase-like protein
LVKHRGRIYCDTRIANFTDDVYKSIFTVFQQHSPICRWDLANREKDPTRAEDTVVVPLPLRRHIKITLSVRIRHVAIFVFMLSLIACSRQRFSMPAPEQTAQRIAILRSAYAAFNRGDIDAAVQSLAPDIDWSEPTDFPGGGSYHGREAAKQYLANSRASVAEVISKPEQFIPAGDRIVVFVHARVRPKNSTTWQEVRLADVYLFRGLTPIQMKAFADRHQALEWANAQTPPR